MWKKLKNGLFGWKFVKSNDMAPCGNLCDSDIVSSTLKTLEKNEKCKKSEFKWMPEKVKIENNTSHIKGSLEQRKIIVKRKLEGENLKGAIKRLNLDSGASEN